MNDGGVAAMNKLAAFRQEASVGARVTLRLTRGEDVSGRVAQLDDAYVRLDLEGRTVTIFAEILAGWELHHGAGAEPVTVGRREALRSPAKLYPDDDFRHLDNRYAPFAEGGPVDEPNMFVGRGELLDRLEHSLLAGSASKSIVMFGQKRAGKSSLLEHLRRRLAGNDRVVPVCFSMQDIASDLSVTAFLHRILQSVSEVLEELRFDGRDVPDFAPPAIEEMESHPETRFHGALTSLMRDTRRHPSRLSFVFLIDEFTDIFKEIRRGRIPSQFMKTWKAIIEKKYFASVLVGQDIMPAFKATFPN